MGKSERPIGRPKKDDPKVAVSIRLDRDLLDLLKTSGPKWQTRINSILRETLMSASETLNVNTPMFFRAPDLGVISVKSPSNSGFIMWDWANTKWVDKTPEERDEIKSQELEASNACRADPESPRLVKIVLETCRKPTEIQIGEEPQA